MSPRPHPVLIIANRLEDREHYRRCLLRDRESSYGILEAKSGQQGLDLWRQHQPDVVLLDHGLPDLDGLEFLTQLQALTRQERLPVLVVIEQDEEAIVLQMMNAGVQDYLVKRQISPVRLQLAVKRALETKQLRTQLQQQLERESQCQPVEVALRESEERLRSALKASRMGTWNWNIETGLIQWSDNLESLFGLESREFDGSFAMFAERLHPDDRDRVLAAVNYAVATGEDYNIEFRIVYPNGTVRWALSQGKVFYNPNGQPVRMAGNDIDITERKRSELILQESEQRLKLALEGSGGGLWDWEIQTNKIAWSPENFELHGFTPQQGVPQYSDWYHTVHPDDRERATAAIARMIAEKQSAFRCEFRIVHRERGVRWLLGLGRLILDEQGEPLRLSGINLDITAQKQAEAELRESEEHLRYTVELNPQVPWTADPDGNITSVSERWFGLTGMNREQIMDKGWMQFLHPDDLRAIVSAQIHSVTTGAAYDVEHRVQLVDGSYRWMRSRAFPRRNEQGKIVQWYGTTEDIDDRKQAELECDRLLQDEQAARAEAERANRIKDEFLAILSHELRSPLNPILGWAKLLQSRSFSADKMAEALATIERNAKLQIQLIDDLLDTARILRGKLSLNIAPVDLVFVIEEAIETVRAAAAAKSIQINSVLIPIGLISGDATRLQQIVWNLLSNAIKFTPSQGRIDLMLEQSDHQAQITICDTGKGINPAFLPYLFESFRQEDASTTRNYGGLGLGLAIVRYLVEAHGGTIGAESQGEGQGSTFTVRLPLIETEPVPFQSSKLFQPEMDLSGVRILAVDDEPDSRELLTAMLTQYNAEVLTVASATEVLSALESFQPDVLVSDVGMPNLDGYALMQQVRKLLPEKADKLSTIALTAYAREEDRQRALSAGFQQHIAKPIDPNLLVQSIASLIH